MNCDWFVIDLLNNDSGVVYFPFKSEAEKYAKELGDSAVSIGTEYNIICGQITDRFSSDFS